MASLHSRFRTAIPFNRRIRRAGLLFSILAFTMHNAPAQSPHEVLVLVNRNHADSVALANLFVRDREIPPANVVELDLPSEALAINSKMSLTQFQEWIWKPAHQALSDRKLGDHVWIWVYSAGFPLRCTVPPGLSLTGITFSKGSVPDSKAVQGGQVVSPLFAGPAQGDQPARDTASPVWAVAKLGPNTPIPSMVLGHTGARGTPLDTALDVIRRGVASDFSRPAKPSVFHVTSKDIRSTCREWQFAPVAESLKEQGFHARVTPTHPAGARSILGLQYGRSTMPESADFEFLPGAMAEHLTSFAGAFWVFHQTKLSYWLRKGATASCGTVVEPHALWPKFPHARFFEHYAQGTSMLESFYLSTASPFQLLIMGEPLARPFASPLGAEWVPLDPASPHTYGVTAPEAGAPILCQFLLNGQPLTPLSPSTSVTLPSAELPAGEHELRAAISALTPVRRHTQLIRQITLGDDTVRLLGEGPVRLGHPVPLRVTSSQPATHLRIMKGAAELASVTGSEISTVQLDSRRLGLGPSPIHAEVTLVNERTVRSAPWWVEVIQITDALSIRSARVDPSAEQSWKVEVKLKGVDPVIPGTLTAFTPMDDARIPSEAIGGQPVQSRKGTVTITPGKAKKAYVLIDGTSSNHFESFTTTLGWKAKKGFPGVHSAGIVFNYQDGSHYDFFGMHRGGGWKLLTRNGKDTVIHDEWGMPISYAEDYPLELEVQHPQGIIGRIAGHAVLHWKEGTITGKPLGFFATEAEPVRFSSSGTKMGRVPLTDPSTTLSIKAKRNTDLLLRAHQGSRIAEKKIALR